MKHVILIAVTIAVASAPLSAQAPSDTVLARVIRDAAKERAYVRVSADGNYEGRVAGGSRTELKLVGRAIPFADIRQIETRTQRGGGAAEGALVGAAAGAIAVFYMFGAVAGDASDDATWLIPVVGIGGMVGGLLGVMFGLATDPPQVTWNVVWPVRQ